MNDNGLTALQGVACTLTEADKAINLQELHCPYL